MNFRFNPDGPLAPKPFALSLSKGRSWFDKLTTNGGVRSISPNGQSGFNAVVGSASLDPTYIYCASLGTCGGRSIFRGITT